MILGLLSEDLGWERVSKILAGEPLRGSTARDMSPEETQWRPRELGGGRKEQGPGRPRPGGLTGRGLSLSSLRSHDGGCAGDGHSPVGDF